jgi:hypothetical protein
MAVFCNGVRIRRLMFNNAQLTRGYFNGVRVFPGVDVVTSSIQGHVGVNCGCRVGDSGFIFTINSEAAATATWLNTYGFVNDSLVDTRVTTPNTQSNLEFPRRADGYGSGADFTLVRMNVGSGTARERRMYRIQNNMVLSDIGPQPALPAPDIIGTLHGATCGDLQSPTILEVSTTNYSSYNTYIIPYSNSAVQQTPVRVPNGAARNYELAVQGFVGNYGYVLWFNATWDITDAGRRQLYCTASSSSGVLTDVSVTTNFIRDDYITTSPSLFAYSRRKPPTVGGISWIIGNEARDSNGNNLPAARNSTKLNASLVATTTTAVNDFLNNANGISTSCGASIGASYTAQYAVCGEAFAITAAGIIMPATDVTKYTRVSYNMASTRSYALLYNDEQQGPNATPISTLYAFANASIV